MRGTKLYGIVAAAFMAGAFLASPELRAYAADTIGSADIIDESIQSVDIKNGEVKASDIAPDAVTSSEIAANAVTAPKIAANSVGSSEISDNAVTASEIAADAVGASEIAADAVGSNEIAANSVGASEIAGVSKLIFAQCVPSSAEAATVVFEGGDSYVLIRCSINNVDRSDSVVASMKGGNICFDISRVQPADDLVILYLRNDCPIRDSLGSSAKFSIIVYDTTAII